ncbi:MAG: lacA 2 [Chloroflexi bacterium]|nr:lacA 2 [Chloroflexota bacterium]MDB5078051.1 lacA 2 [Chloroflexota bacterium]
MLAASLRRLIYERNPDEVVDLARRARNVLVARTGLRRCTSVGRYTQLLGRVRIFNKGTIIIGSHVRIHSTVVPIELAAMPGAVLEIGDNTFVNYGVSISCHQSVLIGRDCLLGSYVNIMDNTWHDVLERQQLPASKPVVLQDNVWLGNRVIVLPGVTIGHDAVVGAGAVVSRDIPPRSVAVGVPAQVIKTF